MWVFVIFASLIIVSAANDTIYSTDEIDQFILDTLLKNKTIEYALKNYKGKLCASKVKPDLSLWGVRRSDIQCVKYILGAKNIEDITDSTEICRLSLISQILKGIVPKFLSALIHPIIYGGRPAMSQEFPHMGAIGWRAKDEATKWIFKCGGTLISKNFLLTAAHCSEIPLEFHNDVVQVEPEIVRLGVENISEEQFNIDGNGVDMDIKTFIVHPEYESPMKYYDIALIEFEDDVQFKSNIHPACLWSHQEYNQFGESGIVTGWGKTETGYPEDDLQVAIVDFFTNEQCDQMLKPYCNRLWCGMQPDQMCAGVLEGGVDTCQGDSGGPLQVDMPLTSGKMYIVLGVTSFGKCARKAQPGVYSRVSSFIDWIEENVWDDIE